MGLQSYSNNGELKYYGSFHKFIGHISEVQIIDELYKNVGEPSKSMFYEIYD